MSGASPLAYWLSAYVWDVLLFFVLSILVMLSFVAYGKDASKVGRRQEGSSPRPRERNARLRCRRRPVVT